MQSFYRVVLTLLSRRSGWGGESRFIIACRMSCVRLLRWSKGLATTVLALAVQANRSGMELWSDIVLTGNCTDCSFTRKAKQNKKCILIGELLSLMLRCTMRIIYSFYFVDYFICNKPITLPISQQQVQNIFYLNTALQSHKNLVKLMMPSFPTTLHICMSVHASTPT